MQGEQEDAVLECGQVAGESNVAGRARRHSVSISMLNAMVQGAGRQYSIGSEFGRTRVYSRTYRRSAAMLSAPSLSWCWPPPRADRRVGETDTSFGWTIRSR